MTGKDILTAMNNLEDTWIESENPKKKFPKALLKWGSIAAACIIFLGGGVAYAAIKSGLSVRDNFSHDGTAQYSIHVVSDRVSIEQLTGEIQTIETIFKDQLKDTDTPVWKQTFPSVNDALTYIGYDKLKAQEPEGILDLVFIRGMGNKAGQLTMLELYINYRIGDMLLRENATLFTTNHSANDISVGRLTNQDSAFAEEAYINANGKEAIIMTLTKSNNNYYEMNGHLADGAVLYQLSISFTESSAETAKHFMYQWLDRY